MFAGRIRTRDQANLITAATCSYNTVILNATQKNESLARPSYDTALCDNEYKCAQKVEFIQFVAALADVKSGQCRGGSRSLFASTGQ
jgi:hypothetical protein